MSPHLQWYQDDTLSPLGSGSTDQTPCPEVLKVIGLYCFPNARLSGYISKHRAFIILGAQCKMKTKGHAFKMEEKQPLPFSSSLSMCHGVFYLLFDEPSLRHKYICQLRADSHPLPSLHPAQASVPDPPPGAKGDSSRKQWAAEDLPQGAGGWWEEGSHVSESSKSRADAPLFYNLIKHSLKDKVFKNFKKTASEH